jgi:hypothetical protein
MIPSRAVASIPAAAFVLTCALLFAAYSAAWPQAPVLEGDSAQYLEVARDLRDGSLDILHFRTPGYPLLLALTGSADRPSRVLFHASLLLHFVSVWLLCLAFARAGAPRSWLLALAGILLLPPYVEPAAYVMTENLTQFLLVCGYASMVMWFATRQQPWALAAGTALSACAIVRPVYQLLVPALCVGLMILDLASRPIGNRRRNCRSAVAVMLLAWTLLVGGVAAFNKARFGWFGIGPSAGFHLSTKTMTFVERLPDEYADVREILIRERDAQLVKRGGTHTGTQTIWGAQRELEQATGLSMPELSGFLLRMNLVLIRRAPVEYLAEVARSSVTYWLPASGTLAAMDVTVLRWAWALLHATLVVVFGIELAMLLGIAMIAWTAGRAVRSALISGIQLTDSQAFAFGLAAAIVFYTMLFSCLLDIGEPRHRRPTDLLFIAATVLALMIWKRSATLVSASARLTDARA